MYAFAPPRAVADIGACHFYHVMDLPGFGTVKQERSWDLRGRFADYTGGVDLHGRSLLDVGTASGFLSFEAEKAGAREVIGFDADSASRMEYLPSPDSPRALDHQRFERIRNAYWFAHHALGSKAKAIYGDLYRMAAAVPRCDIVLVGQILVHIRDPLGALQQAALAAKETLIVVEGSFESTKPTAVFLGAGNYYSWWHLSVPLYRQYLAALGFEVTSVQKNDYKVNHPDVPPSVAVWSIVAKRVRD